MKKPIFKKWWFWVIIVVVLFFLLIAFYNDDDTETANETTTISMSESVSEDSAITEETSTEEISTKYDTSSEEGIIEATILKRISEKITFTNIDDIKVNEDLGTDKEGDYIALVYLTWEQENSGKLSKEVLTMYSSDLAAIVAEENSNVQEIAIFWTVPYLNNAKAKCAYERKDGGMYEMDMVWDGAFSEQ